MPDDLAKEYDKGIEAARHAIVNGCPRRLLGPNDRDSTENSSIDLRTGLPIMSIGAPPELADRISAHVNGYNDEIDRALAAREFDIDFRPLLMSRQQLEKEFFANPLGVLSLENPRIEDSNGQFMLYLKLPKPRKERKSKAHIWAVLEKPKGETHDKFWLYDGPVPVATGHEGKILILKTELHYLSYDLLTTQPLNRYMHHWPDGSPAALES